MAIVGDKDKYYLMIMGTIQHEDTTLANIYAPNTGAPEYMKQILMDTKREIIVTQSWYGPLTRH